MNAPIISTHLSYHSCSIHIGSGLLQSLQFLRPYIKGQQLLFITQDTLAYHYLDSIKKQFTDLHCSVFMLPDGERHKTMSEWQKILDYLFVNDHDRTTTLIALGGGMVGDMTGFAAACYMRGVAYIQIPTSLMAQVDSAMGGKTGVNYANVKNLVGAFYQPTAVVIDVNTLATLPQREFQSAIAEIVKYGLIKDETFFSFLEKNFLKLLNRDTAVLLKVITFCVETKTEIVMQDEKDQGTRKTLNFGHTFAHALESALQYQILHGEAVAWGIYIAGKLSVSKGFIDDKALERIKRLLQMANLLQPIVNLPAISELMAFMKKDKKVINQNIHFILLEKIGKAVTVDTITNDEVIHLLQRTAFD